MWSLSTKMIIFCLTVMLIMTVAMASSNKNDGEAVESVETCSKDDQICQKAAKGTKRHSFITCSGVYINLKIIQIRIQMHFESNGL